MRILVVNDDGIEAAGIIRLAALAKELGEVWVVAPDAQCSAMSQRITVRGELQLRKRADFPVEGVEAYSLSGTPADCVKVAVEYLMKDQLPDIVFSGINKGYNVGYEIAYSGTVGATWEAISKGIRAIAFSVDMEEDYAVTQAHWSEVTRELLTKDITSHEIWNVNFPGCSLADYKGIQWDTVPAKTQYFLDHYDAEEISEDCRRLTLVGIPINGAPAGTDISALMDGYISVSKIQSTIYKTSNH